MILNYKFENFMFFRENVEFSMLAPKSKVKNRFPNNYITSEAGIDLLKTAVIVGENAGGKSNFVRSLFYLQSFFAGTAEPVWVCSRPSAYTLAWRFCWTLNNWSEGVSNIFAYSWDHFSPTGVLHPTLI